MSKRLAIVLAYFCIVLCACHKDEQDPVPKKVVTVPAPSADSGTFWLRNCCR